MRIVQRAQPMLGEVSIEDIVIDEDCRDDIPAALKGIQYVFCDSALREKIFTFLSAHLPGENINGAVGRLGMTLWNILVLGLLKQGAHCDYDRLHDLANQHRTVREMLGHSGLDDKVRYNYRTLVRNISLLTPELLAGINRLVVEAGHALEGHAPEESLKARCDSFVVETAVHYPTDVNLLWDAMRCLIRETAKACKGCGIPGWRQSKHLTQSIRARFNEVRTSTRQKRNPQNVVAYLDQSRDIVARAEGSLGLLMTVGAQESVIGEIQRLIVHAHRQIDQIDRRVLKGEVIPHEEKVFSIFEDHTRWCMKGKAGRPVELGVPLCIVEDQHQFILHHEIMWKESDVDVATRVVEAVQGQFPALSSCSFDKGFHSPSNRKRLEDSLELVGLPGKGRLSQAAREYESTAEFVAARKQHPAVESAINNLEQRGLDRIRSHGADGFARTVALSVLAGNLHRIGLILQKRTRKQLQKKRRKLIRLAA